MKLSNPISFVQEINQLALLLIQETYKAYPNTRELNLKTVLEVNMNKFLGITATLILKKEKVSDNRDYCSFDGLMEIYSNVIRDNCTEGATSSYGNFEFIKNLNWYFRTIKNDYNACRELLHLDVHENVHPTKLSAIFLSVLGDNAENFLEVQFDLTSSYISHDCNLIKDIIDNFLSQPLPDNWDYLLAGTSHYTLTFVDGEFESVSTICDMQLRTLCILENSLKFSTELKATCNQILDNIRVYSYVIPEGSIDIEVHKNEKVNKGWTNIVYHSSIQIESQVQSF